MTLEEYKKRVEECYLKRYPNTSPEDFKAETETLSKKDWEEYMRDFSAEELPAAWAA